MMNVSIVIPAYNESKHIGAVLNELKITKLPIIVVDDGSRDSTFEIAEKISRECPSGKLTILRHKINLGKGGALKTGCDAAFSIGSDAIIMMDADGQHKVSDLPKFIQALEKGFDVVFGSRNLKFGVPLVRFLGNKCASLLISFLYGIYVSDLLCGYRAFTKKAYKKIQWQSVGYGVETEMVIKTGESYFKCCEVSVETVYYDKFKGVTVLDAFGILFNVLKWRLFR
ncbi:MAG: putative glycosyltransferase [Candidatus Daviesbacteria bacterium GW2011_GWA2_38_24]|uniref:Putative glycosyltransferase n=1 Tax=Candidatus Daviesbacteria bacterium GW2011_GWA2_38_24 TaxID=1618422 RepID=A0A0G0MQQ5_9BACT|nr:MAG: putative glycosyltransferase [Candidatus Levybacteria bacterium GW2011_GWC2_37_7]KKQ67241.1 MAG: putative glycosyltransferase [Candidatus Daviesbacteria bacterium GW2011_GWA2_38_24]KKQ80108.1 MAG: putative glycosyltransferase [Candidatus Daviesbacteria bacterium GW2011_GWA1_38_7]